ncbi:MAG: acyl-CoA/acyl-ACP dehydrogenase [SAR324 cluster bacterium]|nr:acyl-CoA/acyl-ACP dehydrogenase [SAR324 cluster bacterium]
MSTQQLLQQAQSALDQTQGILNQSLTWLKEQCISNDRVSASKLDEHQLVSYDLAWSSAEVTGARFALDYAKTVREQDKTGKDILLEEQMTLLFVAESVQNIKARLGFRLNNFGLTSESINALNSEEIQSFCTQQMDAKNLTDLGKKILELKGRSGIYLLEEQAQMMQEEFRKFANDTVMPLAEEVHRKDLLIPDEILGPLTELGCFGISIPERYGGIQSDDHEDNMGMIVVTEELSRGSLGASGSLITRPEILARALLSGGTEEQRTEWLPKLAMADPLCAVAVTEPDAGSDVAAMKLKATKTDGGWLLNGVKSWCTFGAKAGVMLVLARTNPDMSAGHRGLSLFLAEKESFDGHDFEYTQPEGGTMSGRAIATIGYRGMHSYEVFYDNYFVPDKNLIGGPEGEGKGFYFTMAGFSGGRIQTAARAIGLMQAAFERAVSYSEERAVFGKPIGQYQLTLVKLARMATLLTVSRQFTYAVGRLMDGGKGQMEASMVKFFTCKSAEWLTREAQQIHGGMGYAEETAVSRYFVDARVLSIFEGAEEILALKVILPALVQNK